MLGDNKVLLCWEYSSHQKKLKIHLQPLLKQCGTPTGPGEEVRAKRAALAPHGEQKPKGTGDQVRQGGVSEAFQDSGSPTPASFLTSCWSSSQAFILQLN